MQVTGHLEAMQLRLQWIRWVKAGGAERLHDAMAASFQQAGWKNAHSNFQELADQLIELAEGTYFVVPAFCQLIAHLAQTIPDDVRFSRQWMPTDSGFIVFAETPSIPLAGVNKFPCPNVVAYSQVGYRDEKTGKEAEEVDLRALAYYGNAEQGIVPIMNVRLEDGWTLTDTVDNVISEFLKDPSRLEHAQRVYGQTMAEVSTNLGAPVHYLFALFSLFGQKLATFHDERPARAQRRQIAREQIPIPPLIQIVTLRRLESQGIKDKNAPPQSVDWQWQWLVNTHWRRQYYPSTGEHKYITIDTYVKGPEDKPMKPPRARVFMVRR